MIEARVGDLFAEPVEALVNPVNCVGVMGRGVALEFKERFPENFKAYAAACRKGEVRLGEMFVHERPAPLFAPSPDRDDEASDLRLRFIINFPTKRHWREKSRMEHVESGIRSLAAEIRSRNIASIAIPAIGSGLGGLEWSAVRPRIEAAMREFDECRVVLFEPREEGTISEFRGPGGGATGTP